MRALHRIILESPTLKPNQPVPRRHTAQGKDVSPALEWRDLPPNTKQLVVALIDRDTVGMPGETPFLQWLVYGIPATATGLPEGLPETEILQAPRSIAGALQARTRYDVTMYRGPQPLAGEVHHYRYVVYALDAKVNLKPNMYANTVLDAIKSHIIGEGEIAATYKRGPETPSRRAAPPK